MGLEEQLGQPAPITDELVDRTSSSSTRMPVSPNPTPARPPLSIVRQGSSIVSVDRGSVSRDYVYSLHHNFRTNLLYGKNNVCVAAPGEETPIKGYLSLHKNHDGEISLKWTPNQLMHASSQPCSANGKDVEQNWKQAIQIQMQDIIYIHLHQKDENYPSTLTFVNCEGVQSAPLQLPAGQHSLVFLTALETGLAPSLRLDPPLWAGHGKEKALPRLRKRSTASPSMMDYVFRLVRIAGNDPIPFDDIEPPSPPLETPPNTANNCISLPNSPYIMDTNVDSLINMQMGKACESMRHQILARAFYGWLTYCRHLKTIRKHLLYLVETNVVQGEEDAQPVDEEFWKKCRAEKTPELEQEFLSRVYWKGIEGSNPKELRRQAWPYLIGLFKWDENQEPKTGEFTKKYRYNLVFKYIFLINFRREVDDWRVLEAEVRKRDEEAFIAARAKKFSSPVRECSIASDVFEEDSRPEELNKDEPCSSEILLTTFTTNLHRIDKDVERCDRNLFFFSNKENLESLRRVMITYVRRNLDEGYVQGMCDLLAPLLVIFEDGNCPIYFVNCLIIDNYPSEALTIECFSILMSRLRENFPQRTGMDECLSNLRSLIQVIDPQVFSLLSASTDCTHLYFSYRWFLLDFKRELSYDCTYKVWETIWAANRTFTPHFALFFALAIITNYRDVIIGSQMDFTDMIKFFNEMAERHDCTRLLQAARLHIKALQNFVQQLR
ncbi:hypothetical protein WR25_23423 isoform A [Diploscapter pachys]|uniref:Rab-GAP TBC domain-containing protein n=1 Tax=Diploscapter pachys TaxID=2018661 RepID=A0A2A2JM21_9BILA|nr:hypothetical protein WR25_23423 isoform A [Diploscapter pachys]